MAFLRDRVPLTVQTVIALLSDRGFDAVLVGGAVRDLIRGVEPGDFDVATSATPDEVIQVFGSDRVIPTGIKHGTVTVKVGTDTVEVTTFRTDGAYADGRRPDGVSFVRDLKEDLSRRDFTINAMALRLEPQAELVDPFGGRLDLMDGVLRTVGSADDRFNEDGLRAVRAARFAAVMELKAADGLEDAMKRAAPVTAKVAVERFTQELIKMLTKARKPSVGLAMLQRTALLDLFMPGVVTEDFFIHLVDRAESVEARLAGMLNSHKLEEVEAVLLGLKMSTEMVTTVTRLVTALRQLLLLSPLDNLDVGERIVRRTIRQAGGLEKIKLIHDALQAKDASDIGLWVSEVLARGFVPSTKELAVNGHDIMKMGISGQQIGLVQRAMMDYVDSFPAKNTREDLTKLIIKEPA